jgi:Ataxin-3
MTTKKYIYHERQESALCGQHCLNNLLQGPYFDPVSLGMIANELDRKERQLFKSSEYSSSNVDDSGNFSIQVLNNALMGKGVSLDRWFDRQGEHPKDPLSETAFVVNLSDHWFTIRQLHGHWWNLNSSIEVPELVSNFYLSALLATLSGEGYSIFNVTGQIPESSTPQSVEYLPPISTATWYLDSDLLANKYGKSTTATATTVEEPKFQPFSGKGNKLVEKPSENLLALHAGAENDEELQLALAISASLEADKQQNKPPTKEELRAKRLAALSK